MLLAGPTVAGVATARRTRKALRAAEKPQEVAPPGEQVEEKLPRRPSFGEFGISGTANWSGDIYDEANAKLYPLEAFGQPGAREWGFYTKAARTDPAVAAGLEYVASMLRDATPGFEPAEGVAGAQAHADFVKWCLVEACAPGWDELIQQVTRGALLNGHAIFEECWEVVKSPLLPGGAGFGVTKLAERLPVSVQQNGWIEEGGELVTIKQTGQGPDGKWVDVELPASKVSLFSWNRTGNNYRGVSQFRPVYYPIRVREQLVKLLGVSSVREGAGIPIAFTTDKSAKLSDESRKDLQKFLENCVFHENAAAVMPSGWQMDWVYSQGANKGHVLDSYNGLGIVILQQVQGQHLVLGTNETGSRSVGEVHTAQSRNFARGVIAFVCGVFNGVGRRPYTGLVRKLVEANFGPQLAYPKLTLTLPRSELGPNEKADAISKSVAAGALTILARDENALRKDLGLEPIEESERTAELERKAALAPKVGPGDDEDEDDPPKKPAKASAAEPWSPKRPLRPSERHIDFAAIDARLTSARADFERGMRPLLVEALVRLAPAIKDAMVDGDPSEVANLTLPAERLSAFVDEYLAGLHADGWRALHREWKRGTAELLRKREQGLGAKALRAAEEEKEDDAPAPAPTPPEAPKSQKTMEAMRKQVVRRIQQRVMLDVEREAIEVIRQGGDADEVVSRTVQRQLDTGSLKGDAGILVTKAFNMGREDFARERGDEVESVELSALLDGKQCIPCDGLDGRTFKPFSEEHEAHVPPLTAVCDGAESCRCIMVYNFEK